MQAGDLLALSTVIVAPTSTAAQAASFRPEIVVKGKRTRVLTDQVTAVDVRRLGASEGVVSFDEINALDASLSTVLGLR